MNKIITSSLLFSILLGGSVFTVMAQTPTPAFNLECVRTAVDKREGSIITAWDSLNIALTGALSARKSSLYSAWSINDQKERRTAIKNAWQTFKNLKRDSAQTFNSSRKTAWSTFKTEAKACNTKIISDEPSKVISEVGSVSL